MRHHTSVFKEFEAIAQEAADKSALNAVHVLAQWLAEKGHPELAEEMKAAFIVETPGPEDAAEEPEPDGVPGEGEV